MKTMRGIYYDLEESDYIYRYRNYKFYFSSKVYLRKFKERLKNYVNVENKKFQNRLKVDIDFSHIFALDLYKKIEKRGFLVLYKDKKLQYLEVE